MKFPSRLAGRRFPAVIAVFTAVVVVCGGTAHADTAQDPGTNRNEARRAERPTGNGQSTRQDRNRRPDRRSADELDGAKVELPKPNAAEAWAKSLAEEAAAIPEDVLNTPIVQEAALATGGSVPTVGMGGLVPNARLLAAYISATYPGVQAIGGVRADPLPDHPSGHAIDIMIGSDMGLGDAINADVQGQAGRFGVVYTLWRVANHYNHVHVTVS